MTKYYLKAMGCRCYNMHGITFPNLEGIQRFKIDDDRSPNGRTGLIIKVDRGRFGVEHTLYSLGARGLKWGRRWSNQPDVLLIDKFVDYDGNEVDDVCDEAGSFLFNMGLILRPITDWIDEGDNNA